MAHWGANAPKTTTTMSGQFTGRTARRKITFRPKLNNLEYQDLEGGRWWQFLSNSTTVSASVRTLYNVKLRDLCGSGSIATELRAERSGVRIPVEARFSTPVQTGPGAHPASCTMGNVSFPGVESGRGVTLTPHPLLVPRSKNRVEQYLYSP
jgi:hypothetical protein